MQSKANNRWLGPPSDSLEVTLLGPGHGEAVLIHLGNGQWIAIDSCRDQETGRSAPLVYLEKLELDARNVLRAVVISHFDDDHVRGIAELVKAAPDAEIVIASVLIEGDFYRLIARISGDRTRRGRTGADEISEVLDHLADAQRSPVYAHQNRQLFIPGLSSLSHGHPVSITSLSPADAELQNFLNWVGSEMPRAGETRRRLPKRIRNDVSVVLLITVGDIVMLFGADLEEEGQIDTGWSAILNSRPGVPFPKAEIYKIAHHGSETGHHPGIWSELLTETPVSILSPWINGGTLVPSPAARALLLAQGGDAYATTTGRPPRAAKRSPRVDRTIKDTVKAIRQAEAATGMIRLRLSMSSGTGPWEVALFDGALAVKDWPAGY